MKTQYDVAIIGGGPAGLSAALTIARGGRSVFIIDEGKARNAPASHMMNFPSRDGTPPEEFRELIRQDLQKYPTVHFEKGRALSLDRKEKGFVLNQTIHVKKVLMAHGIKDVLPPIPGFQELWGKAIFHCPYCHGHEHRNAPMGLIASGNIATHMAPLLKGLTSDVILFTNGGEIDETPFDKNGIKIYSSKLKSLVFEGEKLLSVKLENGEEIERSYLFYRPEQKLTTDLGTKLGCELNEFGLYKTDEMGMTSQPGIYAAGDISTPKQSVLMACATGSMTGAGINFAIQNEEFMN